MKRPSNRIIFAAAIVAALAFATTVVRAADPLPSWSDTAPKQAIIKFVEKVTKAGSPEFVPAPERIATFDNDGTLWCEQPMYVQMFFILDRIRQLAPQHPEWKAKEPFASVLKGDVKSALAGGERGLLEMIAVTHAAMTTEEFEKSVTAWLAAGRVSASSCTTPTPSANGPTTASRTSASSTRDSTRRRRRVGRS